MSRFLNRALHLAFGYLRLHRSVLKSGLAAKGFGQESVVIGIGKEGSKHIHLLLLVLFRIIIIILNSLPFARRSLSLIRLSPLRVLFRTPHYHLLLLLPLRVTAVKSQCGHIVLLILIVFLLQQHCQLRLQLRIHLRLVVLIYKLH